MTTVQKFFAWMGGGLFTLIAIIVVTGVLKGTLDLGLALGILSPVFGGIVLGIVGKAKADNDRDRDASTETERIK